MPKYGNFPLLADVGTKGLSPKICFARDKILAASPRHRYQRGNQKWRDITEGYLLVYFGILLILGATKMRRATLVWSEEYGTRNPIIMNAMTYNAFRQLRQHLHFVDNSKVNKRQHPLLHC